jgi:hypothetical protein
MEAQLRELINQELRRRHGIGLMEGKIKPVHIANALMREEHHQVGRMPELKQLMVATAPKESAERRLEAATRLLERNRERWGRLADEPNLRKSVLMTRVLPLLRTILGTDGAAFGSSADFSSFSSPTVLTVTRDPSDDHAGALLHRLWGGDDPHNRLRILEILHALTSPQQNLGQVDDLTAVLAPLTDDTNAYKVTPYAGEDLGPRPPGPIEASLRTAAIELARYEDAVKPNPIATLQRIITLASVTLFFFTATRPHLWAGLPLRPLLLDASGGLRQTALPNASERTVKRLLDDARTYMGILLTQMLQEESAAWSDDPESALNALFDKHAAKIKAARNFKLLHDILDDLRDSEQDVAEALPARLVELIDSSSRGLDGYLRLLGIRSGLLYPQQSNKIKRLVPIDRTLEVLVGSTIDVTGKPVEYRDFLDGLYARWRIVVGGRLEDAAILADAGAQVPTAELTENSERFLSRLQAVGLGRKLADTVAVVGLTEGDYAKS